VRQFSADGWRRRWSHSLFHYFTEDRFNRSALARCERKFVGFGEKETEERRDQMHRMMMALVSQHVAKADSRRGLSGPTESDL